MRHPRRVTRPVSITARQSLQQFNVEMELRHRANQRAQAGTFDATAGAKAFQQAPRTTSVGSQD